MSLLLAEDLGALHEDQHTVSGDDPQQNETHYPRLGTGGGRR